MQLADQPDLERAERETLAALNASDHGQRVLGIMRRELSRLDRQNRVIGCENKESAAQWIADFLELADSRKPAEESEGAA